MTHIFLQQFSHIILMQSKTLIIVESPAKCAKIESYLDRNYKCIPTFGHICTLNHIKDIDIDRDFAPTFTTITTGQIAKLKRAIESAANVIIATDDDPEGESIGYHICRIFGISPEFTPRCKFHDMSRESVCAAIANPSKINMAVVNAQIARQIIDVLVGFTISPQLWKNVGRLAKSAGRCQTPALRLIYDNSVEIDAAVPQKQYKVTGCFASWNLEYELSAHLQNEAECEQFLLDSAKHEHINTTHPAVESVRREPFPFTTSTLQQAASSQFRFSPKETMKQCQILYEGGFITYMRTDCAKYSPEFLQRIRAWITTKYGNANTEMRELPNKNKTQDAHEAIRPTELEQSLAEIPENCRKLYALIRQNTIESCMKPAIYSVIKSTLTACLGPDITFGYSAEMCVDPGWQILKGVPKSPSSQHYVLLQHIANGTVVSFNRMDCKISMTNLADHYTEAQLIKKLEYHDIGRPSTFASLVDKIQTRDYVCLGDINPTVLQCTEFSILSGDLAVTKIPHEHTYGAEKNRLIITQLGKSVCEYLNAQYLPLFEYTYTNKMQQDLDKIEQMEETCANVCRKCYTDLTALMQLDATIAADKCGEIKRESADFVLGTYNDMDVILKRGKYGTYAVIGSGESETKIALKKIVGNRQFNDITLEEVISAIPDDSLTRTLTDTLTVKTKGKNHYIFRKKPRSKKPEFLHLNGFKHNPLTCELSILLDWIALTHGV